MPSFQVVCVTDLPISEQLKINQVTHANGIRFISSEVRGVFGRVFCDFGRDFVVFDPNDEPAATSMVGAITQDEPGVVTVLEDHRHGLETGDVVVITEVEGMTEVGRSLLRRLLGGASLPSAGTEWVGRPEWPSDVQGGRQSAPP